MKDIKTVNEILGELNSSFNKCADKEAVMAITLVGFYNEKKTIEFGTKDLSTPQGIYAALCGDTFVKIQAKLFQEFLSQAETVISAAKDEKEKTKLVNTIQKMIDDIKKSNPLIEALFTTKSNETA